MFYQRIFSLIILLFIPFSLIGETHFLWNLGSASLCDVTYFREGIPLGHETVCLTYPLPSKYIRFLKGGEIVWVQANQLPYFVRRCLPKIKSPIILMISDGDPSFPSSYRAYFDVDRLIKDPRILRIYTQNFDGTISSEKVHPFPIGIDFHTIYRRGGGFGEPMATPQEQEAKLIALLETLKPTNRRIPRAFCDFHLSNYGVLWGESRLSIREQLEKNGVADFLEAKLPRSELHRRKGEYAFSISPHGNGLDCHRTWEDLVLGCIVIVKSSSLDPLYVGLPVVIVKDWSEVTEENLETWLDQFQDAFTNPFYRKKLTNDYWMKKVRAFQNEVAFQIKAR